MPLRHPTWRRILAAALVACLPLAVHAQSDQEKARSELRDLRRDIDKIQRDISSATGRRDKLQQQLRTAEVELGRLQRSAAETRQAIKENKGELASLEDQQGGLDASLDQQKARIATELRAAWQMGQQGQIKVLLNQQSPHTMARVMGYYRYFFEARNALLHQYRDTLNQLQDVERRIADTLDKLEARNHALQRQQQQLVNAREARTLAVAKLNQSIRDGGEQLRRKERDRKELEELLAAIEEAVVNLEVPENFQAFGSARGKMPWPVKGQPSNRFGKPRNEGKMRWQGITIPAEEGTTVRAIHHGRVVYADWLRGSGLLLIIDHGDGYMSLYAHNQSLLREVGEWVSAGTPVSTVGDSGGLERAALYFEIRHQGKPTDPARWCRG
jgi:septal ring factor EnvC (AmiA/AmiB activator)